jgi:hypothetical protein
VLPRQASRRRQQNAALATASAALATARAALTAAGRRGAIAHIGFLFSGLVDDRQLSFLEVRPIR